MKKAYFRPWLRPVALYGLCDSVVITVSGSEEDDDDSDKTRQMLWDNEDAPLGGVVGTHKFWNE